MGYDVVVTKVDETRALDARNQPVKVYRFTFNVGQHGPFTQEFSADEVGNGTAKVKLSQFAAQIQAAAS